MRRGTARLVAAASQAAAGDVLAVDSMLWDRAAWLLPAGGRSAATAAAPRPAAARPHAAAVAAAQWLGTSLQPRPRAIDSLARGVHASAQLQHDAEPAAQQAAPAPAQREHERTCWQCGTPLAAKDLFFCPECESVQPASADVQYFRVFGIDEPTFDLDVAALDQQYRALQFRLHPDRFARASPLELEYAQQQAAAINAACDVLRRPLRRAHYILSQRGFGACEGMTITDPELLMYVMEAREEVEGTPAEDVPRLQALLRANAALEERCLKELSAAFAAGDMQHAAELTTQLRYICRIKEAIEDKL